MLCKPPKAKGACGSTACTITVYSKGSMSRLASCSTIVGECGRLGGTKEVTFAAFRRSCKCRRFVRKVGPVVSRGGRSVKCAVRPKMFGRFYRGTEDVIQAGGNSSVSTKTEV